MAENLITPEKSHHEDDILNQLSYKQLQQLAMSLKLPANLKHGSLLVLIKARQSEDTDLVERIVSENRQLRNRARISRTRSTSPGAESLTLSPPISPECLLRMSSAPPLASSSPKNGTHQSVSNSQPLNNESLPQTDFKAEQMEGCIDVKPNMLETAAHLLCKETVHPHSGSENVCSSGTLSSDRSPDPLELESPSTYCTDSATNSVGSDIDPLVTVKDCLDFSEKEIMAEDLTELKPVPPSELIDLSFSEPLLDPSLVLRPTFTSDSLQTDAFLHPVHNALTPTLITHSSIGEGKATSPLANLYIPDSTIDGQVKSTIPQSTKPEYTQAKLSSHTVPLVNIGVEEPSITVSHRTYSQKRQSLEFISSPTKLQKTTPASNIVQPKLPVSTVPSNPTPQPLVSRGEFPHIPSSLTVVTVPATICYSAVTVTMIPKTYTPVIPATSNPSINTQSSSGNFSDRGTTGNLRKSIVHFITSPVSSTNTRLPTRSSSRSTKASPAELLLPTLPKLSTQTNESNVRAVSSLPKKAAPAKSTGLVSRGNVSNKPNTPNKQKTTLVKLSQQELCYLYPDFFNHVQFRSVSAPSQTLPMTRTMANPIYSAASNPPYLSRQTQNIRPPSQHAISSQTASTVNPPRRMDQPVALPNNSSVFATQTVPTRNPANIATPIPRPARPESVLNLPPPSYPQANLPSFNYLLREQAYGGKQENGGQTRQPEVCATYSVGHGDSTGETLPNPIQPRVDLGTHPAVPLPSKPPQMDFPPAQSVPPAFVGQNLPHDSCLSTLRQLLEAPVYNGLPNRDFGRRHPWNPYQYDNQNINQFIRPQPTDHFKDMTGIGQMGNYPLQMQNFPRTPFMPLKPPESAERLKTKDILNEPRLAPNDLPKNLESIFNYRSDAVSAFSTPCPKYAIRSGAIDTLFVTSGIGPTHSVDCYEAPICSVKSKPARNCYMGGGSHQTVERYRASQEFVPYSSNYPSEQQSTDIYGSSSLNAALNQPCEPSWFSSEPCLPAALPVNQYWPQAVNPQPAMRLPQPFRAVNQRNPPNQYFSPLKSLHVPTGPSFFNQPPINQGYQTGLLPLPDIQSYQPPESFDKVLPLQENIAQLGGQDLLSQPNQAMNQCQNQIHQDVPDFQGRGDQLSLSMIYNYLASTEHQMPPNTPRPESFDNQPHVNQRPVYSRPIFPGTNAGQYQQQFGNASSSFSSPSQSPAVSSAPVSRRACGAQYGNGPAKSTARRQETSESTTLTREAATASVIALRKQSKERHKCVNAANGCTLTLPLSQLAAHEECCDYINLKCPKETCEWNGRARKLANHVREAHRTEISSGSESKYSLPDIEVLERVCFLQEVSRKLFAICVNCHGGVLYVSIQYIASGRSERPTSACGTLEVLGHDGHPHSWRGKLLPYFQSVETLLTTSSCLEVSLSTLGAFGGSTITLHVNIRVYSGNTNSNAQPSN